MNLTIVRHVYGIAPGQQTRGFLYANPLRLPTLEEAWVADPDGPGGQRRTEGLPESCVPDGVYTLRPHVSAKFGLVYALVRPELGVWYQPNEIPAGQKWGRSAILIHGGSTLEHTLGCILVPPSDLPSLREVLGRQLHTLTIRPTAGTQEIAA